ncbi:MAG: hypothetical protein GY859_21715 [Desulfobacterales bacterium]|nr:hypothetical protein [Desulfobacterales bacterium]
MGAKTTQNLAVTSEFTGGVKQAAFAGVEVATNHSLKVDKISGMHIENNSAAKRQTAAAIHRSVVGTQTIDVGNYVLDARSAVLINGKPIFIESGSSLTLKASKIILEASTIELKGQVKGTKGADFPKGVVTDKNFKG